MLPAKIFLPFATLIVIFAIVDGGLYPHPQVTNVQTPRPSKLIFPLAGDIYTMNSDGSELTLIASNTDASESLWSPDGTQILYTSHMDGNDAEVFTISISGMNQSKLTDNNAIDIFPAWSPSGSQITFTSNRDDNLEIYVMNSDGTNQTNLTQNANRDITSGWSPDGNKIAFSSDRDGDYDIYVMDSDGSNLIQYTNSVGIDDNPRWSPDGTKILFRHIEDNQSCNSIYVMDVSNLTVISMITNNLCEANRILWLNDDQILYQEGFQIYSTTSDGTNNQRFATLPEELKIIGLFDIYPLNLSSTTMPSPTVTPTPNGQSTNLRDVFSAPTCQRACWLGIQPGVTTKSQVQTILSSNGIAYEVKLELGLGANPADNPFGWIPDDTLPFIDTQDGKREVRIYFQQDVVQGVYLPVDISLSTVLAEFGSPDQVRQTNAQAFELTYPAIGVTFLIGQTDTNRVVTLNLWSELAEAQFLEVPNSPFLLQDCSLFDDICTIQTATPSPTAAPVPNGPNGS